MWFGSFIYFIRIRKEIFIVKKFGFFVMFDFSDVILSLFLLLFWVRVVISSKIMNNIVRNKIVLRVVWEMGVLIK